MEQYHFCLDVIPGGAPPVVHAVQYDNLARELCITLTDGGADFVPDTAVTGAYLYARRPDGTQLALAAAYDSGTVTVKLSTQLTLQAGRLVCLVCLTGGDEAVLGSAPFVLEVSENPCEAGKIVSGDDFRDVITAWAEDHAEELAKLYGDAVSALSALADGYLPENMLPWPYYGGTGGTDRGVTYTVRADGSVHCEGTPTGVSSFYFAFALPEETACLPPGTYTLSGGQSDDIQLAAENASLTKTYFAGAEPVSFVTEAGEQWFFRVRIRAAAGPVDTDLYPVLSSGGTAQAYTHPQYSRPNLLRRIAALEAK